MRKLSDAPKYPRDAIALLQADHRAVEDFFRQYQHATDRPTREHLVDQVCAALERHAHLEETVFYPALEAAADPAGDTLVADARQDHHIIKDLIVELEDVYGKAFDAKFRELMHTVQHHVYEEECALFPKAEQILGEQLADLLDEMVECQQHLTASARQ